VLAFGRIVLANNFFYGLIDFNRAFKNIHGIAPSQAKEKI